MHYHLEVIMPPVSDVEAALAQIMQPFNEDPSEADEDGDTRYSFWDFYTIGGRWAGYKMECMLDKTRLEEFRAELTRMGVTVSGLQCGKQELSPASQIPAVDKTWAIFFPDSPLKTCPLFRHFNDPYKNRTQYPDIMTLDEMPKEMKADHLIIAGPHWDDEKSGFEARHMLQKSIYNGVSFMKTVWDGSVTAAIEEYKDKLKNSREEYALKHTPRSDWLVVTVDYHS